MFDTHIAVIGNVLSAPEWRRTARTGSLVANFKVASTARRMDRDSGRWIDGDSLRVRVSCWRRLAEGVASSLMVGDPVVVYGRLYTRDWTDADGARRTTYEMEALAVGHDLARGRGTFARHRPAAATSETGDDELRVRGEQTEPVPIDLAPARPGETFREAGRPSGDPTTDPAQELRRRTLRRDVAPLAPPLEDELEDDADGALATDLPEPAEGSPRSPGRDSAPPEPAPPESSAPGAGQRDVPSGGPWADLRV
ncbi:single-stranded DNA-binding protein [Pilimelia columellifera]|uniref:Single-stranded DNA-binding protein n=1 Tax=Pilimelia columellifera subsp. columellifera TaxID=706583 RepID=A0ABN3NSN3_9ACTN